MTSQQSGKGSSRWDRAMANLTKRQALAFVVFGIVGTIIVFAGLLLPAWRYSQQDVRAQAWFPIAISALGLLICGFFFRVGMLRLRRR